jgi:hypothetical protein
MTGSERRSKSIAGAHPRYSTRMSCATGKADRPFYRNCPRGMPIARTELMRDTVKRSHAENGSPVPRELLTAKRTADVVAVPKRRCIAIDGAGSPHDPRFQDAIESLFGVAYALKFARKKSGKSDFKMGPLESHWSADVPPGSTRRPPPEQWRWRVRIGVPPEVTKDDVDRIKRQVISKKGGKLQASAVVPHVFLESIPAQRLGRVLHVGSYGDEAASFALISTALDRAGLTPALTHIEVYRNDPRRTRPAALETVLLRELAA